MDDLILFDFALSDTGLLPSEVSLGIDWNFDGISDLSFALADTSGNVLPDQIRVDLDWNSDGTDNAQLALNATESMETVSEWAAWMDYNDDGAADISASAADINGDFKPDIPTSLEVADHVWGDLAEVTVEAISEVFFDGEPLFDSLDAELPGFSEIWETHGTPAEDLALWDAQDDPASCAVATTNMMFRSLGLDPGEPLLAEIMQQEGVYDPMQGSDVSQLSNVINTVCDQMGVAHQAVDFEWSGVDDLANLLDSGARPLIALDAVELYEPLLTPLNAIGLIPDCGHAVQLIGLKETAEGTFAILNDPDLAAGVEVPIDRLISAGDDFGFHGVALV